jgi:DEAD/DEAH box helicase domain-containing protein
VDVARLVEAIAELGASSGRLVGSVALERSPARYAEPRTSPSTEVRERIERVGAHRLYRHQADAWDAYRAGNHVAVVTGAGSGKTLCYNLPALHACLSAPAARALYVFPTKALAQDQLGKLHDLLDGTGIRPGTYDGDTSPSARSQIRRAAQIVLTNPDMLHAGILPRHEPWTAFLRSLKLVVVDEMHAYRGVFGSHVAWILRRLRRLCEWHGSRPQFIGCSATVANPLELFRDLTGLDAVLVAEDGSARPGKDLVLWDPAGGGAIASPSPNRDTAQLIVQAIDLGAKTMAFCRARQTTEWVLKSVRRMLASRDLPAEWVDAYRGGYSPKERRQIERALFRGDLKGIVTTSAMELGVDVGDLDLVIVNGYPGSLASFRQQIGRSGRLHPGAAVYVVHADPLEQYLARDPEMLVDGEVESVIASPENAHVTSLQLRCAAYERPLEPEELSRLAHGAGSGAEALMSSGALVFSAGKYFFPSHSAPAAGISIRGIGGSQVQVCEDGREVASMEPYQALRCLYPGSIYLHRGQAYLVKGYDPVQVRAEAVSGDFDYFTKPIVQSLVEPQVLIERDLWGQAEGSVWGVRVTTSLIGYSVHALDGDEMLRSESLQLPPISYDTLAVRLELPEALPSLDSEAALSELGGLHAAEHALTLVAPIIAACDRNDLGSVWYAASMDTFRPAIFVFDAIPAGAGLAECLYRRRGEWAERAWQLLDSCSCENGCPKCLLVASCESDNQPLDKPRGKALLGGLRPAPS